MPIRRTFTANEFVDAVLVLSDGDAWPGKGLGLPGQKTKGEICFNVSMTGYQEIMTDPSYAGQIITFTFPHIGNVGQNVDDLESRKIFCKGLVLREPITLPSNYRSQGDFETWLRDNHITGLSEVDTRALARNIREKGPRSALIYYGQRGELISIDALLEEVKVHPTLLGQDLASQVSTDSSYTCGKGQGESGLHVVVMDFGIKTNILRCLVEHGIEVTVVPAHASFEDIERHRPDGIFLSNGPGDPFAIFEHVRGSIESILEKDIPLFGICLGNQLLALASGLNTLKLHQGHRGGNHPVRNLKTGRIEITSQNHGFCVSKEMLPGHIEITHTSLFDDTIEGICRKDKNAFAVQYHPESSPGPHDSRYLFEEFITMMRAAKTKREKQKGRWHA